MARYFGAGYIGRGEQSRKVWVVGYTFDENDDEIEAEAKVSVVVDRHYGADRDGNRGEHRKFVDEIEVVKLVNNDREVEVAEENLSENVKKRLYEVLEYQALESEWE
jgi:hypothetical protein